MTRVVTGRTVKGAAPGEAWDTIDSTGPVKIPDTPGFWEALPMLTHIHKLARARRVAPWALLGAVMAQAVAATSPNIVLPRLVGGYGSLNIAAGLVGPSGAGKGAANGVAGEVMPVAVNEVGIGSGEGLVHVYARRVKGKVERISDHALVSIPEIDSLRGVANRQGSTIMAELRKAWSGEALGFSYADPAKRLPIDAHSYRLAIVAGIQPGRAAVLLDDRDGGTPQRFLWLPAVDPDAPEELPSVPRKRVIEHLDRDVQDEWEENWQPDLKEMEVAHAVREEIDADRLARLRDEADEALDGHAMFSRLKVAAAIAIIASDPGKVTDEDWALAGQVMEVSNFTRQLVIGEAQSARSETNRSRGRDEADRASMVAGRLEADKVRRTAAKITNRVKKLGDRGQNYLRPRDLRDAVGRDREFFEGALDAVVESGILVKSGRGYRLP